MDVKTYISAWKEGDTVLYMDAYDCKYAAKQGNLPWRINNPGLVKHHCHFAKKNGSIGAWEKFAIFSHPLQGHQALKEWLRSKKMYQSDIYAIAKHYQPVHPEPFVQNLVMSSGISPKTKLKNLTHAKFEILLFSIEKICGFIRTGNEEFYLLPKIAAKIECPNKKILYLVGQDLTLTHDDAMDWITSHRLDAVIVHHPNNIMYLRSRPRYRIQSLKLTWEQHCEVTGELDTLAREIGKEVPGQCVWGFINGIRNTKEEALESCNLISAMAEYERVLSLPNDQVLQGFKEGSVALLLKLGIDTPIVKKAVKFFRYLLSLSKDEENNPPVIVFAHSQGAAIAEHALALLSVSERLKIRVFTFGGWSFISPDAAHPESHNYSNVNDVIPRLGSFNNQYFALKKYEGCREELTEEEIIWRSALEDAFHDLDTLDVDTLKKYAQGRCTYYRTKFEEIRNITVVPAESLWEHSFKNESYQAVVKAIIKKYRCYIEITSIKYQEMYIKAIN